MLPCLGDTLVLDSGLVSVSLGDLYALESGLERGAALELGLLLSRGDIYRGDMYLSKYE